MGSSRPFLIDQQFALIYTAIIKTFGVAMKLLIALLCLTLAACGTVGGAISGAGKDLSRAGEWIGSR